MTSVLGYELCLEEMDGEASGPSGLGSVLALEPGTYELGFGLGLELGFDKQLRTSKHRLRSPRSFGNELDEGDLGLL